LGNHSLQYAAAKEQHIQELNQEVARLSTAQEMLGYTIVGTPATIYCGSIDENRQKHGLGMTVYESNQKYHYVGTYYNNMKHGQGVEYSAAGTYNGMWLHDLKHGKCFLFTPPDGHTFEGDL
jgi:hypothetical protein